MRWKSREVEMIGHGNLIREGVAMKGDEVLTVTVYPEQHDGERVFTLRSSGPDFGLDVGGRFATEGQAIDSAEGLADAWQAD